MVTINSEHRSCIYRYIFLDNVRTSLRVWRMPKLVWNYDHLPVFPFWCVCALLASHFGEYWLLRNLREDPRLATCPAKMFARATPPSLGKANEAHSTLVWLYTSPRPTKPTNVIEANKTRPGRTRIPHPNNALHLSSQILNRYQSMGRRLIDKVFHDNRCTSPAM